MHFVVLLMSAHLCIFLVYLGQATSLGTYVSCVLCAYTKSPWAHTMVGIGINTHGHQNPHVG